MPEGEIIPARIGFSSSLGTDISFVLVTSITERSAGTRGPPRRTSVVDPTRVPGKRLTLPSNICTFSSRCRDTKSIHTKRQARYMFYSVHTESETRYPGEAQRGTSWSFTGSDQVTSLHCFSRGSQREKMDVEGPLNLTIRLRELRELRVDQMSMRTGPEPCRQERTVW